MLGLRQRRGLFAFLLVSTAMSTAALALEPSGSAVRVTRITDADGPGGARPLVTEGPVFMGDEISTNPNGLAQILFADDTRIVVGPNSRLVIDAFVFNPDATAREVTVSTVQGFFRLISGNSPSEAYTIRTPTMTIGLRGTGIDWYVRGNTESGAVIHEGGAVGCNAAGECVEFIPSCRLYVAEPGGGGIEEAEGLGGSLRLSVQFPWLGHGSQNDLDPEFRLNTFDCILADNRLLDRTPEPQDTIPSEPPPPPTRDYQEEEEEEEYEDEGGECEGGYCL